MFVVEKDNPAPVSAHAIIADDARSWLISGVCSRKKLTRLTLTRIAEG